MTDLINLHISEAADLLAKKEISSVELTQAHLTEMSET